MHGWVFGGWIFRIGLKGRASWASVLVRRRLRFYSQEIVIFRENLVSKMRRHCLLPPLPGIDITAHVRLPPRSQSFFLGSVLADTFMKEVTLIPNATANLNTRTRTHIRARAQLAKTIVDQSYLCPLPLSVRPVYWAYDHALRLFPQPDVVRAQVYVWLRNCMSVCMNAGVRKCGCDCASADQGQLQLMFAVAAVSSGPLRPIPADIYGKFNSQPRCARAWLNAESMIVVDLRKKR